MLWVMLSNNTAGVLVIAAWPPEHRLPRGTHREGNECPGKKVKVGRSWVRTQVVANDFFLKTYVNLHLYIIILFRNLWFVKVQGG